MKAQNKTAIIQMFLGAFIISFSPILAKLSHTAPATTGFYRGLFGAIFLAVILLAKGESFKINRTAGFIFLLCGVFFGIDLFAWHLSIEYIGPGLATIVVNLQVFVLALIGLLVYKERFGWLSIFAFILVFVGLVFLFTGDGINLNNASHLGLWFAIVSLLTYSAFVFTYRRQQSKSQKITPATGMFYVSIFICLFLFLVIFGTHESLAITQPIDWLWLILYGVTCQAIGWYLIANSMSKLSISLVGFMLLLQPLLAFVWDILIFNRITPSSDLIGVTVILVAIYIKSTDKSKAKREVVT